MRGKIKGAGEESVRRAARDAAVAPVLLVLVALVALVALAALAAPLDAAVLKALGMPGRCVAALAPMVAECPKLRPGERALLRPIMALLPPLGPPRPPAAPSLAAEALLLLLLLLLPHSASPASPPMPALSAAAVLGAGAPAASSTRPLKSPVQVWSHSLLSPPPHPHSTAPGTQRP